MKMQINYLPLDGAFGVVSLVTLYTKQLTNTALSGMIQSTNQRRLRHAKNVFDQINRYVNCSGAVEQIR